jgi:exoribonuclease-2
MRVLTETGREMSLTAGRVVHVSDSRVPLDQPREALARRLREIGALREELSGRLDLISLWELLHEEGAEHAPRDLAELAFGGRVGDDQVSAVIRAILADRVRFRFRVHGFRPNDAQTVEKIRTQRAREEEKERQAREGSQWIREAWEGRAAARPQGWEEIVELLKELAIHGKGAPRAQRCEEILRRAGMANPLAPFQVLVRMGIWGPDENLLFHRFGTRRAFSTQLLEEAALLAGRRAFDTGEDLAREDLRPLHAFTVDSPHTHDIDDALSLEALPHGWRAGIHITDVSWVIPRDSPLDQEARLRGTSLYLPEEKVPMFPPAISEGLCSLRVGEIRPAVSLLMEVDGGGGLLAHRFCLSWIGVKERLSYEDVDRAMEEAGRPLVALYSLALAWRAERVRRGALLLPLPEVTVRLDGEGGIVPETRDRESPSQILVSEMMIQANWLAARHLAEMGAPVIYRVQADPRERILDGRGADLFLNYRQRKLLNRAESRLEPGPHSGLGVAPYAMATSPIRRYTDLVTQRQLTASLRGAPPPYSREALEEILAAADELQAQATQMEAARQRYWLLKYLEGRRGEETPALVLGRFGNRVQLLLPAYMLEAGIPISAASWLQDGQEVAVRIVRSKPLEDSLRVELA